MERVPRKRPTPLKAVRSLDPLGKDTPLLAQREGYLYLIGPVDEPAAASLIPALLAGGLARKQHGSENPLHLFISSPGGEIFAGLAIIETMLRIRREFGVEIHTHAQGYAFSMAAFIHQAGSVRSLGRYSLLMFHSGWYQRSGSGIEIADRLEADKRVQARLAYLVAERTGYETVGFWDRLIAEPGRQHYYDIEQAFEMRLIDKADE